MKSHYLSQTSSLALRNVADKFSKDFEKLQKDKKNGAQTSYQICLELLAFLRALEMSKMLVRGLTDINRVEKDRIKLATQILKSVKANKLTIDIISEVIKKRWSKTSEFTQIIREFLYNFAIVCVFARDTEAKVLKDLEKIEAQLFEFREILIDMSQNSMELVRLREILSHEKYSVSGRFAIIDNLIGESSGLKNIDPITVILAKYCTMSLHGKRYIVALEEVGEKLANIRSLRVVKVTASQELSKQQISRLNEILEKKHSQKVQINIIIDKNILGGLKIDDSENIFDGTLVHSFNLLSRSFENK